MLRILSLSSFLQTLFQCVPVQYLWKEQKTLVLKASREKCLGSASIHTVGSRFGVLMHFDMFRSFSIQFFAHDQMALFEHMRDIEAENAICFAWHICAICFSSGIRRPTKIGALIDLNDSTEWHLANDERNWARGYRYYAMNHNATTRSLASKIIQSMLQRHCLLPKEI